MSERKFLNFQCAKCKKQEFVEAIPDDDGCFVIDPTWPMGWLEVVSCLIGFGAGVHNVFCDACQIPVLHAFGYANYKDYISVVKGNTEIKRRLNDAAFKDSTEDVPFYLLDDDAN